MVRKEGQLTDERRKLIEENIDLVWYVCHKIKDRLKDAEMDDIFQYGCLGLINAARTYNPEKGKFSTYAVRGIQMYLTGYAKHQLTITEKFNRRAIRLDKYIGKDDDICSISVLDMFPVIDDYDLYVQDIMRIVQTMHPSYRKIVDLLMQGESQAEIARIMQCTKQNVNGKIKHLQEVIQREYIDCTNSVEG